MAAGGYSDLEQGHDETFDFLCSVCQVNYKNTEAENFCAQCFDYFCSSCAKIHETVPGLKYHIILDKSHFKSGASVVVQAVQTEMCKYHGQKPVDMFCEQDDKVGCSTCMEIDHSACRKKFYIPDYIRNKQAVNPADISVNLDTLRNSIQELQKALNDNDRKLITCKVTLKVQIKQIRKVISQRLDDLEKNTMKRADTTFQSERDNIQSRMKKLQQLLTDIESTQDSLKGIAGNQAQLFVNMKQASDVVFRATEVVQTTPCASTTPTVSFIADQKLQSLLQEMEVLGSINFTEGRPDQARSHGVPLQQNLPSAENHQQTGPKQYVSIQAADVNRSKLKTKQMPSLLKIKGKKVHPVSLSTDTETCDIQSVCVLDDGTIIFADYNNEKLKCLDRLTYRVTDSCDVPGNPWQVCLLSQQQVAVSCPGKYMIQFVWVERPMWKIRQISTDFMCYGLACANRKLYISSDSQESVYVYTVSGRRLQQLRTHHSGQCLFSNIQSLAVSSDSSRIYVADIDKGFIILDASGKLVCQYNDAQLAGASGVCVYKNDSVLVHGWDSNNVLQFTADGQLVGEVLKTNDSSGALCWDEKNSKLVIPKYEGTIEIYDINTEL